MSTRCQSCGMPLKKDPGGGGTNLDSSKSTEYCSKCYQHGAFIAPDMTSKDMQTLVIGKLKEMHFPGFLAWLVTRDIPRLRRWKTASLQS